LDAKGMTLNYNCGIYYEFIPFNEKSFDSSGQLLPDAKALSINEVQEGVDYAILLTTCAGSWRYLIGDTIKFVDLSRSELVVTGRTKHFLSICGEHLSVDNMNEGIVLMQENLKINICEFTVFGVKSGSKFSHKWYISSEPFAYGSSIVSKELDAQLKKVNDDYASARKAVLDAPEVIPLPPAVFYKYLESKGKIGGQAKFPRVMNQEQFDEWESYVQSNYFEK